MSDKIKNDIIKKEIIDEAKRIAEDTLYSSKKHFIMADIWTHIHMVLGLSTTIISAFVGKSALLDNNNMVTAIFAILAAVLAAIMTFLNPKEKSNLYHCAGNNYLSLKNSVRRFYRINLHLSSNEELDIRLEELAKQRDELNQKSPVTPWWTYMIAKICIKRGESDYAVDKKSPL